MPVGTDVDIVVAAVDVAICADKTRMVGTIRVRRNYKINIQIVFI